MVPRLTCTRPRILICLPSNATGKELGPANCVSGKHFDIAHFVPTAVGDAAHVSRACGTACYWIILNRKTRKVTSYLGLEVTEETIYKSSVPRPFETSLFIVHCSSLSTFIHIWASTMDASPSDSVMKMDDSKQKAHDEAWDLEEPQPQRKRSGVLTVVISGLALFSDGYNAQISR